jgi:Flp pilus assembly pilin Flp
VCRILRRIARFFSEDAAQDLIEYSLLIAFVAMVAVGIMSQLGVTVQGPWGNATTTLATANGTPSSPSTGSGDNGGGDGGGGGHHDHGDGDGH